MPTLRTRTRFSGKYDYATRTVVDGPIDAAIVTTYFNVTDPLHLRGHSGVDLGCPFRTEVRVPIAIGGPSTRVSMIFTALPIAIGNFVVLDHGDNLSAAYWHLDEIAAGMAVGDVLAPGDLIGYAGATGEAYALQPDGSYLRGVPEATHLHWMAFPTDSNPFGSSDLELWNPLDLLEQGAIDPQRISEYVLAGGAFQNLGPSQILDGSLEVRIFMPALDNPGPTGRPADN